MRRLLILLILIILLTQTVFAMEFTAPEAPEQAQEKLPTDTDSFSKGLWFVIQSAIQELNPSITQASANCLSVIAVILLVSILHGFTSKIKRIVELVGSLSIAVFLIQPTNSLINLGTSTITELSEYGKLLLPVMTTALAAQGGTTSSAAIYTGTALFNSILVTVISKLLVPMVYVFLCLCIANSAMHEKILKDLRNLTKWLITWGLKIIIYIFTGYIAVTGVVSGTTDASAIKAAKIAISGTVPVVGSIISDASEAILVSAGVMKNAAGVYGLLAMIAIYIGPFLKLGVQYLMLKVTAAVCGVIGNKESCELIQDFSVAMGLILAMVSAVCLLHLISTVCFMKGVS